MTYCPDCTYLLDPLLFPGPNGLCLWEWCTYCGYMRRLSE